MTSSVTGSSGSPNFRVDVIVNSLRELQQEKEHLQQHFSEEKSRCKSLEMKLEACQAKYYQNSERNCKMLETVNAAKQKVLQTQIQASRLKGLNDVKGAKIQDLRKQIDEETKKEQMELQMFEEELAELTNKFRNARNYYTEENLQQEIEQWRTQAEKAKAEISKEDDALKELTAKFHQIEVANKQAKDEINGGLEFGLTLPELESTLKVFEKMNQETKEKLQISEEELGHQLKRLEEAKCCQQRNSITSFQNEPHTTAGIVATASAAPVDKAGSDDRIDPKTNGNREQQHENLGLDSPSDTPTSEDSICQCVCALITQRTKKYTTSGMRVAWPTFLPRMRKLKQRRRRQQRERHFKV